MANSPTLDLLVLFGAVYVVGRVGAVLGAGVAVLALSAPIARPWTLVTTVYAHASLEHLLTNAVALALVGFGLERYTTRVRFHAFVLGTGTIAAIAELLIGTALGGSVAVLGASGAILALYGYVIAGNRLVDGVSRRFDPGGRVKVFLLLTIVVVVTYLTAGPGVALVAHATGFLLGLVAGRLGLLSV